MTTPTKLKIISILAVLGGPFAAMEGYKDKQMLAEMEKSGVTVPGEIMGGESSKKRRSSSYSFDVAYTPQGAAAPVEKSFKVKADFFKAHVSGDSIGDPKVQVRYMPANPDSAIIVDGSTDDTALFPIGIGAAVVGLGVALFMFTRKESPAEA
ncbi:DUF3592 domain-containing protein [Brevifollis gellanilyticus]|uniref:DUF3592 domain-containing protein n=1 Tax=Brevifollis gellanilyticus TaxID=748831 RepID=A0A512M4J4_9BACT|nr:DUF3592 domain-containing protein [Brevifollis gellanilyticus]GEP41666.1 hypothetical protein BGE01nite_09570 [Brevifollis gellanilyticus]